jgi:hypothetical protein
VVTGKEDGPEVDTEKTRYIMSCVPKAGQNRAVKTTSKSFEFVAKHIPLEITVTNENVTYDEIKSILNVWNACYH